MNITDSLNTLPALQRDRVIELQHTMCNQLGHAPKIQSLGALRVVVSEIDDLLSKPGRLALLRWLFGRDEIETSNLRDEQTPGGLTAWEIFKLLSWGKPTVFIDDQNKTHWACGDSFHRDLQIFFVLFSGGIGQPELFQFDMQKDVNHE